MICMSLPLIGDSLYINAIDIELNVRNSHNKISMGLPKFDESDYIVRETVPNFGQFAISATSFVLQNFMNL